MKKISQTCSEWPVRKVSLQLKQRVQTEKDFGHRRVSLNYSENLKKRTAAIITQNKGMSDLMQNESKCTSYKRTSNSNIIKKALKKSSTAGIAMPFNKAAQKSLPSQRIKSIELNAHRIPQAKDQELEEKNIFSNYNTVSSKILEKANTPKVQPEPAIVLKKRPLSQYMGRTRTEVCYQKKQKLFINSRKATEPNPQSNRNKNGAKIIQQCIVSQQLKTPKQRYKKEVLKTSEINLSHHFAQSEDKFFGVQTCKKMTVSNINRYYELCIKDIKNLQQIKIEKDLKRKQIKTEPIFDPKELIKNQEIQSKLQKILRYPGATTKSLLRPSQDPKQSNYKSQVEKDKEDLTASLKKLKKKPPVPGFRNSPTKQPILFHQDTDGISIDAWEGLHQSHHQMEELS